MDERKMSGAVGAGDDAGVSRKRRRHSPQQIGDRLLPTLAAARWLLERWQLDDNHRRPHSALGYTTAAAYAAGLESLEVSASRDGPPGRGAVTLS